MTLPAVCRRGGPLRPFRVSSAASKEEARLSPVPGWRIHRGFCDVCDDGSNHMHGNPASASLGLRLRQNNQNSQNEPGMSFGINKPCRARSGPDRVAGWVSEADRGRVELTVAVKHREKA